MTTSVNVVLFAGGATRETRTISLSLRVVTPFEHGVTSGFFEHWRQLIERDQTRLLGERNRMIGEQVKGRVLAVLFSTLLKVSAVGAGGIVDVINAQEAGNHIVHRINPGGSTVAAQDGGSDCLAPGQSSATGFGGSTRITAEP